MKKKNSKLEIGMIFGVALFVLALPSLLTQTRFLIFDFSQTGQVGDTIGGITAPIVGLLGAWLVYRAFTAQIEANKIQSEALLGQARDKEMDIALRLLDDAEKKLIIEIEVTRFQQIEKISYLEALRVWAQLAPYSKLKVLDSLHIILMQFFHFAKYVFESKLMEQPDKRLLFEKAYMTIKLEVGDKLYRIKKNHYEDSVTDNPSQETEIFNELLEILQQIHLRMEQYIKFGKAFKDE